MGATRPASPPSAGAAAAAVLVGGLAVTRDDPAPVAGPPPMEQVAVASYDDDVTADAALVNHTWGVEVKLTATGFDDGRAYQVVVVGTDGRRYPAGAFVGTGSREMHCNLSSAVLRPDAVGFEVRTQQRRRGGQLDVRVTGRLDDQPHHAVAQALGPVVGEADALVHRAGAVVEERRRRLLAGGALLGEVVRVALDDSSAGRRDQVERAAQRDLGQALLAVRLLDLDAGDPPVGRQPRSALASYCLRWWMVGSSSGVPYSAHATACPSRTTSAAWATPSSTPSAS